MLHGWGWEKGAGRKEETGRVSDTAPVPVPASSPAFARKVLYFLTLLILGASKPVKLQPYLINFSAFCGKERGDHHKAETLLDEAMSTSSQSWSRICGKETDRD